MSRSLFLATTSCAAACLLFQGSAHAAKRFSTAQVTKAVNDVRLLLGSESSAPASVGTLVKGDSAVQTGTRSRSELTFPDESIVRLGSNSVFSFDEGERDLNLSQGTLLLQAPKFHGKTEITTAAVTAAITGTTILMENVPPVFDDNGKLRTPGIVKIIVVEGKLEFALVVNPRKKMRLGPGEMVIIRTTDTDLPAAPMIIDLKRMVQTSLLMGGGMGPLPDMANVNKEVAEQSSDKESARLLTYRVVDVDNVPPTGQTTLDTVLESRLIVNNAPAETPMAPAMMRQRPPRNANRDSVPPPVIITPPPPPNCIDISGPIPEECIDIVNGMTGNDIPGNDIPGNGIPQNITAGR